MCWPGLTWYSSLVYEGLAFPYTAVVPVWRCRVKCIMCEPIKSPQLTQSFSPFPGWACNENINQCGLSRHDQMCQRKSAPVPLGKNWCHTAPSSCVPNQGQSPSRDAVHIGVSFTGSNGRYSSTLIILLYVGYAKAFLFMWCCCHLHAKGDI